MCRSLSTFSARNILGSMMLEARKLLLCCSTRAEPLYAYQSAGLGTHRHQSRAPPLTFFLARQARFLSLALFKTVLSPRAALSPRWRTHTISPTPPTGWIHHCHFSRRWSPLSDAKSARTFTTLLSLPPVRTHSARYVFVGVLAPRADVPSVAARTRNSSSAATGSYRSWWSSLRMHGRAFLHLPGKRRHGLRMVMTSLESAHRKSARSVRWCKTR